MEVLLVRISWYFDTKSNRVLLELFIRHPIAPGEKDTLWIQHCRSTNSTFCMVFGLDVRIDRLEVGLPQWFGSLDWGLRSSSAECRHMSSLIGWLTYSFTALMKLEYKRLDQNTNDIEAMTGESAFDYRNTPEANNEEYGKTLSRAHKVEGQLLYVVRSMEFQTRFFEFLKELLDSLMYVEGTGNLLQSAAGQPQRAKAEAAGYLEMCLAGARERCIQSKMLASRIQIQLTVVCCEILGQVSKL